MRHRHTHSHQVLLHRTNFPLLHHLMVSSG
jgi:hypothetical protein